MRDPKLTDQKRSWPVNKTRTDMAMIGTKLNARVIIKNLQNMHAKSLPPTGAEREGEWNYIHIRTGPACKAGDHTRADPKTA